MRAGAAGWKSATSCQSLSPGYGLRTQPNGEAFVSLAGGGKVFLDASSQLSIQSLSFAGAAETSPIYNLSLNDGALYVDAQQFNGGFVLLETPSSIIGLYEGSAWVNRDSASQTVSLDLQQGSAVVVKVEEGDTPSINVVEPAPGLSISLSGDSTLSPASQQLLYTTAAVLAASSTGVENLTGNTSLSSAVGANSPASCRRPGLVQSASIAWDSAAVLRGPALAQSSSRQFKRRRARRCYGLGGKLRPRPNHIRRALFAGRSPGLDGA